MKKVYKEVYQKQQYLPDYVKSHRFNSEPDV